jgi:hypothetical protein
MTAASAPLPFNLRIKIGKKIRARKVIPKKILPLPQTLDEATLSVFQQIKKLCYFLMNFHGWKLTNQDYYKHSTIYGISSGQIILKLN